jgi:hypothetical protein
MLRETRFMAIALFLIIALNAATWPQEPQRQKPAAPQKAKAPAAGKIVSHPPMRPLPSASNRPLAKGPSYFVDPVKGADAQNGSEQKPWKTVTHAVKQLKPGDTLYLRGGTYYESVTVAVSGTADRPITIRSYPGELAILDGGLREFYEAPATAWEPVPGGAEGEYRSTKPYPFGGGFGNFGDSMVPLHRYINFTDLRTKNELWHTGLNDRQDDPIGLYCGPGVRRDPETGRIHVRLAHTLLPGLGKYAYRGETDPRKLPLVIAGHDYTLKIEGARHLRIQDLVVRGGQRAAVYIGEDAEDPTRDAEDIELDGLTLYGSGSALRVQRTNRLRLINCALHGHAAPWHSRAHHKYRAHAGYLVMAAGNDFEFAHCEFTDHHDGLYLYYLNGLRLHHSVLDNFNDDGIEPGPKKKSGKIYVYQNLFTRCLNPFTAHGNKTEPSPADPGSGMYVYRNIVDLRQSTYGGPPTKADLSGAFLSRPTTLICHDHGSPTQPPYHVYHNSFLLPASVFRGYYAFTWGSHMYDTQREVFNNIFVQVEGIPGLNFSALTAAADFQADGNLHWGLTEGPKYKGDFFAKYRQSPLFEASKKRYPPGWAAADLFADPKFVSFTANSDRPDLRLQKTSPAVNAGVPVPADWPDPLRKQDTGRPDIGALPLGAQPWTTGVQRGK